MPIRRASDLQEWTNLASLALIEKIQISDIFLTTILLGLLQLFLSQNALGSDQRLDKSLLHSIAAALHSTERPRRIPILMFNRPQIVIERTLCLPLKISFSDRHCNTPSAATPKYCIHSLQLRFLHFLTCQSLPSEKTSRAVNGRAYQHPVGKYISAPQYSSTSRPPRANTKLLCYKS